ncbi:N-acetylmuramoyl-L-alanine amidase-like domain-containing protein [Thermophagus xiamenensis]|uniref:DUF1460 domain-containing protein n=1 Tax=Thermophagus xiamenensis TaxID=385682 RepID=A0A1I2F6G0_9BACT|nr:N-acetylmuramoyl-L-alanine amidase-like domain-containing protein [Thermophagus xiamenensis]SFF00196.1 Protein of unknown function [Thermophagus xiamenensis]
MKSKSFRKDFPNILFISIFVFFVCFLNSQIIRGKGTTKGNKEATGVKFLVHITKEDSAVFKELMEWSHLRQLDHRPLENVIIDVAQYFLNQPYVAHTLESDAPEKLIVNLREFDCTTFVENVLALSFCIKDRTTELSSFLKILKTLRYRDGRISGYDSRLHYFTEWLSNNEAKGLVKIVSNDFGDREFDAYVDFMSSHAEYYPKLRENSTLIHSIENDEKRVSTLKLRYISEANIEAISDSIQNGDIIAFCTSIKGLDVVHVGLAYHTSGQLHFIHASTVGNKVKISENSLAEYVRNRKNVYGILVARPVQ